MRTALMLALALMAALLGTLISLSVWLRTDDFQRRVVPLASAVITQQTGESFDAERIVVSLWPPAVALERPVLTHPATGDVIVTAERVRATAVLRGGRPALGTLTLVQPDITLHLDKQTGLREFRHAARGGGTPMRHLPWSRLDVLDASAHLIFPDGHLDLTDLRVTPTGNTATIAGAIDVAFRDFRDGATFVWDGVTIGPDVVVVPDLALPLDSLDVLGAVEVGLDGHLGGDLALRSELTRTNALLTAPRALTGTLDVDVTLAGTTTTPRLQVDALAQELQLTLPAIQVPTVTYRFGDVTLAATASPNGLDVERARLCFRGLARCDDPDHPDVVEATGHISRDLQLDDAHVTAEGLSLAYILRRLDAAPHPWTDFNGDAEITLSGSLNPLVLSGPFELAVADWHTKNGPVELPTSTDHLLLPTVTGRGDLVLYKDHIELNAAELNGPRSRGHAHVTIGFKPKGPLDLTATLTHADLSDFGPLSDARLRGTGVVQGRLAGPFNHLRFDGTGDIHDFSVIGLDWADHLVADLASPDMKQIQVLNAHAVVGQTDYTGSYTLGFKPQTTMALDLHIPPGGRVEDITGLFLDLPGMTGELHGDLTLHGPLYDMDGQADLALSAVSLFGERFSGGEGHGYLDQGLFTLDDLRLTRSGGTEGLILSGSVGRAWALNMSLIGSGFGLQSLDNLASADLPIAGDVSVVARIDNTLFEPAPHGRLDIRGTRYAGNPLPDAVITFETAYGVTRFTGKLSDGTLAAAGTLGLWDEQPYALSAALSRTDLGSLYPIAADGSPVSANVSGTVEVDGHFGPTPSPTSITADLNAATVRWAHHTLTQTGPWHWNQTGTTWDLTGIGLQGGITHFTLTDGHGDPSGVELRGEGRIDLDLLRAVAPGLSRSDGYADVQVATTGHAGAIETVVDATIAGSLLRHDSFPGTFEDATATVHATRDAFELTNVTASLGGGTLTGGGRITADGWLPKRWDLSATGRDVQIQWISELPPAIGDAELTFDGPVGSLLLAGDVTIREMTLSDRIPWEDWVVEYRDWVDVAYAPTGEPPLFSLDVRVDADHTATLRNNVAEGTASAHLHFIGDTTRPGLTGQVTVDEGVAYLQDREFTVERAVVDYQDPWTWDPVLDFDLATDIRSRNTRYHVNYLIRGPFSSWTTETRSDPPLAQADINALLWFGATTDELEELGELPQALAQGVADFILTDLFITQGRGVSEDLQLFDRIELVTGVDSRGEYSPDPRLLVEKRLAGPADITLTGELNPVNIDQQLVRGQFRLSDQWSVSAWYASQQRARVLSIGGAYGVDVQARWEAD